MVLETRPDIIGETMLAAVENGGFPWMIVDGWTCVREGIDGGCCNEDRQTEYKGENVAWKMMLMAG